MKCSSISLAAGIDLFGGINVMWYDDSDFISLRTLLFVKFGLSE